MVEHRGYEIDNIEVSTEAVEVKCEAQTIENGENGYIVYNGNPINQFNEFTAVANQLKDDIVALYVSKSTKEKLEVESSNNVEVSVDGKSMTLEVRVDDALVGDISYIPTHDRNINTNELFGSTRFNIVNIKKV
jgi:NADH-quinone oxidoreductase subunit G